MQLVGARGQQVRDVQYSVSGTTTSSATVMLVLPEQQMRSSFIFQNLSANAMYLEIGAGEATATISGGAVTGVTLVNSGTNYTIAPQVLLLGGGNANNTTYTGATDPTSWAPGMTQSNDMGPTGYQATAHAVISGGAMTGITVDNPGSGYAKAPWVLILNSPQDPNGVAAPSSSSGIYIAANGSYYNNGTVCTTSPIAVYCATSGSRWQCKFSI
jgi:hypothetical protein